MRGPKRTGVGVRLMRTPLPKPIKRFAKKNPFEAANNHSLALEALRTSVRLTLVYDNCYRVVEVHTVGTTTAGRPAMSVYQIDSETNSTPIPDWRLFCFDECFNVALSDLPSSPPRPDYKKGAKQFKRIDAEVWAAIAWAGKKSRAVIDGAIRCMSHTGIIVPAASRYRKAQLLLSGSGLCLATFFSRSSQRASSGSHWASSAASLNLSS